MVCSQTTLPEGSLARATWYAVHGGVDTDAFYARERRARCSTFGSAERCCETASPNRGLEARWAARGAIRSLADKQGMGQTTQRLRRPLQVEQRATRIRRELRSIQKRTSDESRATRRETATKMSEEVAVNSGWAFWVRVWSLPTADRKPPS